MANEINLTAERRAVTGKKVSQLRRDGIVPAVVYGHHVASTPLQIDARALDQTILRAGQNRLVTLNLGSGETVVALVREIQRQSMTQKITHVDFQAVSMDEPIVTSVPLLLEGVPPALEAGGMLLHALDAVEVRALPANLIPSITVDVSGLIDYDAAVYVRDLVVPSTVEILAGGDELIAKVTPPVTEAEEEAEEAEAASPQPEVISETEAQRRRGEREDED